MQSSKYANTEARISLILRNLFKQMNSSTPMKDPEDYVKNVKALQHGILEVVIFMKIPFQISPNPLTLPCCVVNLADLLDREPNIKVHDLVDEYSKCRSLAVDEIQGYITGEDDFHGVLRCRSKYQPLGPRLDRRSQLYPIPRRKRNLPDTYSRANECDESRERMQPVSTYCRIPSSYYSYSVVETRFSQIYILLPLITSKSVIFILNELFLTCGVPETLVTDPSTQMSNQSEVANWQLDLTESSSIWLRLNKRSSGHQASSLDGVVYVVVGCAVVPSFDSMTNVDVKGSWLLSTTDVHNPSVSSVEPCQGVQEPRYRGPVGM
ncbi:hypothetical protein ACTXT7_001924 [Hymenolepis weldensis]